MLKRIGSLMLAMVFVLGIIPWKAKSANANSAFCPLWPVDARHVRCLDRYSGLSHHRGIDIAAGFGSEVRSVANGTVVKVNNSCSHVSVEGDKCGDTWGNYVKIQHVVNGTIYHSLYAHLKLDSIVVKEGDSVVAGQKIALSGSSGNSSGPHLHLELFQGERTHEKARQSFQYYVNNPSVIDGVSFEMHIASSSEFYGQWVKENCTLTGGIYVYSYSGTPAWCSCSEAYAGWYQVTDPDYLCIRDGHSASTNELGRMPGGEVVYISKATGTGKGNWGHVTYNGISGYCAMGLLSPFAGVDVGTDFCAPILNLEHWKIIENSNGVVQTATETGSANQLWRFQRQSDGSYFIRSCVDGTFLDVYGAYTDMGTTVQTCGETGSLAQRWFIYEDGGGYVLRTALNNYVLDLPNNDPTNGNSLQIWERNGTGAQRWAIYRGEECQLTAPTLSVNVGNSASATQFTWNNVYGERQFNLRIWKDVLWEGEPYHDAWDMDVDSVTEVLLPAGTYHAYIDAEHYFDVKPSNVVTFTVQDPQEYTLRYDANGGTAAPSEQIKYSLVPLTLSSQIPAGKSYTVSFEPNGGTLEAYSKEVSQSFVSWNTASDGSGISYAPKAVYSEDESVTLYAQWEDALLGSVEDLRRDGYYFLGWYDSEIVDSEGKPIGNEYTSSSVINRNITLYAMWTPADTLYFGDVDINGALEFADLLAIRLYMADKYTPECDAEEFLLRADLNRDGQISDADTEVIRSVLLEEITAEKLYESYENASISTDVRTNYQYGEKLDTSELAMQICFSEGVSYSVANGLQVYGYDPYRIGKQTLTVSFYQFDAVYEVQVECTHENKQCISAKKADCLNSGNNQYYICNICNEVLKADGKTKTTVDEEIIAATGHSYTTAVTAPTCTEQGYTTHTCSNCADEYVDSYTDALGHNFAKYVSNGDATCTFDGTKTAKCERCDATDTVTDVGSATGHTMGNWYEAKVPTCTDKGTEQRDCAACDHYETRETEAKGHSYTVVVTAPTCTDKGYTTHTCSTCGDSYKDTYTNATGHSYSYSVSQAPTGNATGVLKGTCAKCSVADTVTLPKLSTSDYSYKVTKEPSYTENGVGSYTWNTDTCGTIEITVSIPKLTAPETDAKIIVSSKTAIVGQQVDVIISLENNPGIASMQLTVGYAADVMTLVGVTDAGKLGSAVHSDNLAACPYTLTWANDLATENLNYTGVIVTLTFQVAEDAQPGDYTVTVHYDYDNFDIFNVDGEEVLFATVNGSVNVTDVLLGDVNSDGKVNTQDRMILTRYLAKWTGYSDETINLTAADVNCDGKVNTQDRMILTRYLAKWTGYEDLGG